MSKDKISSDYLQKILNTISLRRVYERKPVELEILKLRVLAEIRESVDTFIEIFLETQNREK